MDALYFRVSSERQTTENQFEDVLAASRYELGTPEGLKLREMMHGAVWHGAGLQGRPTFIIHEGLAAQLAEYHSIYIEHVSARSASRPRFEQMKRDAALRRFDRVLCWKVSRLGRNMMEVLQSVCELSELGVTVVPVKSATGPITTSIGKLLWAIQGWYAEFENDERTEAIKAGLTRARAEGKHLGRPKRVYDRQRLVKLRDAGWSWQKISKELHIGVTTACREYQDIKGAKK